MRVIFYDTGGSDNLLFFKDYLDFLPRRNDKVEYGNIHYKVLDVNFDMDGDIVEIFLTKV